MDISEQIVSFKESTLICAAAQGGHVGASTIAMSVVAGTLFFALLCVCLYIFCKYLIKVNGAKQKSMMFFYMLCALQLSVRVYFFILSCMVY